MPRETVLFACVENAGRSQMAAALFNALADPSAARALSAGTEPAAREYRAVDLVGAVVDARVARLAVHELERRVGRDPERAVHLDGAVDHVVEHARAPELDERDLDARLAAPVHGTGGVQRHQTRRLDLGR